MRQPIRPQAAAVTLTDTTSRLLLVMGLCLLFGVFSSQQATGAGNIYRWTAADGTTHFGEHPPQGVKATLMSTTTGKPSLGKKARAAQRERVEPGEYTGEPEQENAEPEPQTASAPPPPKPKKDKGVCERARYNLKVLTERGRIRQTDESGEERYLSEEQKDEQIKAAQKAIDTYC